MDLESAKMKFLELVNNIESPSVNEFFKWIQNSDQFNVKSNEDVILDKIVEDIRHLVPFDAILPDENLMLPSVGKNADCYEEVLLHVDSFLFSDDYLDQLVDDGKFSRNYCKACGSKDTKPLTFISHSASISSIQFLFKKALPDLSGKTLIDIGSRLGPILYGAFLFTSCDQVVGIEINHHLCKIQNEVISKYGMSNKVLVVHEDVINCQSLLLSGDVIIMNNVFEFFADQDRVKMLWQFIVNTLKGSSKLLVTIPSLHESLDPLGLLPLIDGFVEEIPLSYDDYEDVDDIHVYQT